MQKRGYIEYLKQVLNLEDIVLAPQVRTSKREEVFYHSQADLCFVTSLSKNEFMVNYKELFEKIVLAMGETESSVCLFFDKPKDLNLQSAKIVVDLSGASLSSDFGKWRNQGSSLYLSTYSLQDIKQNSDFKKTAWKHLQDVMKEISLLRSRPLS